MLTTQTPTRGTLTTIADGAERLATHLEKLHKRQSADFTTIYAFDRHYNPDAPDLTAGVRGWPGNVADAIATVRGVIDEAAREQAQRRAVSLDRVAELWGAVDTLRAALVKRPRNDLPVLDDQLVTLPDGTRHAVTLGQAAIVKALIEAGGAMMTAAAIRRTDPKNVPERVDQSIRRMPEPLRDWIESATGGDGGYRLRPLSRAHK